MEQPLLKQDRKHCLLRAKGFWKKQTRFLTGKHTASEHKIVIKFSRLVVSYFL